jgi:hypothetical protein
MRKGRWRAMSRIIPLLLVGHAVMHIGAVSCGLLFATASPWIATGGGADPAMVRAGALVLTTIVVTGYLLAAMAGSGLLVPRTCWRPATTTATVASVILLAALFSPPAVPGLVIDAILLWAVVARSWRPAQGAAPA